MIIADLVTAVCSVQGLNDAARQQLWSAAISAVRRAPQDVVDACSVRAISAGGIEFANPYGGRFCVRPLQNGEILISWLKVSDSWSHIETGSMQSNSLAAPFIMAELLENLTPYGVGRKILREE